MVTQCSETPTRAARECEGVISSVRRMWDILTSSLMSWVLEIWSEAPTVAGVWPVERCHVKVAYQIPDLVRKMALGEPIAHVQRQQHGRVVVVFPETGRHQSDLPVISRPFYHTAAQVGISERGRRAKKSAVVGDFLRRRLLG